MVIFTIPAKPASRQQVAIDEVPYGLLLTWNERAQGWTVGLEDRDGNPLFYGRRIVLNEDLFAGLHHHAIPEGLLFASDPKGKAKTITREALISGDVELYYVTQAEFENGI